MVAQQRVGYGFDVPRKRGESIFTTSWDPCNMYIPDRCLAQVKSCVVAKSTALLTVLKPFEGVLIEKSSGAFGEFQLNWRSKRAQVLMNLRPPMHCSDHVARIPPQT